jgi:peptide/nickel transport system permease protein
MTALAARTNSQPTTVVSDGLWVLAWKRFRSDRVGLVSMVIVLGFLLLAIASAFNLVGAQWWMEKGVNYARPSFAPDSGLLPDQKQAPAGGSATTTAPVNNPNDPLADVLGQLRGQPSAQEATQPQGAVSATTVDPLAGVLGELKAQSPTPVSAGPSSKIQTPVKVQPIDGPKAMTLPFGGDKWGRDVLSKAIKGAETSLLVGFAAALVATIMGTLLGALAGYYGGPIDDALNWFYSIFNAIPYILLVLAIAAVLQSRGVMTVVLILGLTGWTTVFRLVRAEYLKHKSRDYVRAADAIGASDSRRMFVHILPNVSHVILVNLSLLVVGFIKSEVILSFLGFGVPVDTVSWGSMLNEAQNEMILGYWWQLLAATLFMGILVTAFSLLTDSLRDALDPKLK